ncbi:MAG: FecR family protein [Parabacteroides sp.]|nr:FecR family protein [Parabacteroides sp.]
MQTIYVPAGQRAELILSDSTKVWLNAKTTLTFPSHFDNNSRSVTLDGEGYFDVTHDKNKPFIVKTNQYDIKVLGTEFNVRSYNQNAVFETSLLKGSIQIESADHLAKLLLEPNEKAYMEQGKLKTAPITQYDYFLWKDGLICFDDNTIEELFQKLQLYFDVNIIVKNTSILEQRYTGKFRTGDGIEHILKTLQLRTKFVYENEEDKGNTIIIK